MATVKQYITQLQQRQTVIARKLGAELGQADKQARVLNLALLALLAVLIKAIVDKGVITDADLLAVLEDARGQDWPDEPISPPPPT